VLERQFELYGQLEHVQSFYSLLWIALYTNLSDLLFILNLRTCNVLEANLVSATSMREGSTLFEEPRPNWKKCI
jgi:hypothetical protein